MAIEAKPALSKLDISVIFAMFITIFTGFLMILSPPFWLGVILMVISCLGVVGTVFTVIRAQQQYRVAIAAVDPESQRQSVSFSIAIATQQKNLAILLLWVMPIFPIIYFLSAGKLISDDVQYASTMIVSMAVKLLFASMAAEGHIKATEGTLNALVGEVDEARQAEAFAEHLFHKVSLPLNSIIVGLQVLNQRNLDKLDPEEVRAIGALKESASYICGSLNELVQSDKKRIVAKDALHLNSAPFEVNDLFMRTMVTVQSQLGEKLINCKLKVNPSVPKMVVGDSARLEYVLNTMIVKAIEVAPMNSIMVLEVTANNVGEVSTGDSEKLMSIVSIELARRAPLCSDEEKFLESVVPQRAGKKKKADEEVNQRGFELGRLIVKLHGGSTLCNLLENEMVALGFSIPFEVVTVKEGSPRYQAWKQGGDQQAGAESKGDKMQIEDLVTEY